MIGQAIFEGLVAGLVLSVFVGPIFFTMLQLGVEHGFKAAFALALGQWVGDMMYIFLAFWFAVYVEEIIDDSSKLEIFIWYSGTIGGFLLILFGAGLLFTKSVSTEGSSKIDIKEHEVSNVAYFAYLTQGFLINTVNPTPLIFWMGLMANAISKKFVNGTSVVLFTTVMTVVVITDVLKIYLAKYIRNKIKKHHILYVRRLAGLVLGGFGLVLLIKITITPWFS